jgi:RND family efflux transporter MFP subunit
MSDQLTNDLASLRISRDDQPRARRNTGAIWRWLVALAVLGVAVFAVRKWVIPYTSSKLFKTEVTLTEVSLVSPAQASVDLTATGYVVPQIVAKVGAKVTGRITKVNVREGGVVKAGDILFELDAIDQASAIAAGQARVAAAHAKATAARGRAQVARANLAEAKQTYERDAKLAASGVITQATVDDEKARISSLEEQVSAADEEASAADADAMAAKAEVDALKVNLGNFTIPAPIDGTATMKPSEVGDIVNPSSTLVELVDFRSLLVEVDVPEGRLGQAKKGAPCEIVLDAFATQRMRGEVVEISPKLNRAKATGTVKVKFSDGVDGVLPEMAARVSFLAKPLDPNELAAPPKKVIPANAVVDRNGEKVAFVFDDGKAKMIRLQLGAPFGGGFELLGAPDVGTKLIKDPPANLADGQEVKEKGGEG